jgi:hypothetical protein
MKGFSVVTCPWRMSGNSVLQVQDMVKFREHSTPVMKDRFLGMVQTVWSGAGQFLDSYYGRGKEEGTDTPVNCFKVLYSEIERLSEPE